MRAINRTIAAASLAVISAASAFAQKQQSIPSSFDRNAVPKAGADPVAKIPTWTKSTLSNGAQLIVVERHGLPLVSFTMNFVGGGNQIEAPDKTGLASLTASMMTEGTTTRSAEEISSALQLLGSGIGFFIGGEGGSVQ